MMVHDFVTQFHEIQGSTIGERQRNLNRLLRKVSIKGEEKELVLNTIKPKTYLENLFYIDLLIHLRETTQLWEILKAGDGASVSRIIKQDWFFQELLAGVDAKTLTDSFLPLLSFSVKIKLLKKLSQVYNEEKMDQVFDHVSNRYGLFMATTFITACSPDKISNVLENNNIKLSTHQLKLIYKKDPNLIDIYIKEQKQYNNKCILLDNNLLTYLAQSNPKYFWEIMEKHEVSDNLKLGRKTTKKLIPVKTEEIVTTPKKYIKYLRQETVVRKLNKQGHFKQLYYNLFPRNIRVLENETALCNSLLKYYPKSYRYNLFTQTFHDITKEDIWNYSSFIRDDLLTLIVDKEIRGKWANLKYRESSNEEYLKFYAINESISLIKKKINSTSAITTRCKLLTLLVTSCAVNKDLKALEEVLAYYCTRHRNDDKTSRVNILDAIENNFNLAELNNIHWKFIVEIFTIQKLNNEHESYYSKLRIKHIEFLFGNNGSDEERTHFILEYLKERLLKHNLDFVGLGKIKNIETQRNILLQIGEHIESVLQNTEGVNDDNFYIRSQFLAKVLWFNKKHPEYQIDIQRNTRLMEVFTNVLDAPKTIYLSLLFHKHFAKFVCKLNRNDFENMCLNHHLKDQKLRHIDFDKVMKWCLKHDPLIVLNNLDNNILELLPKNKPDIFNCIKRFSHLLIDDKIIKICVYQLTDGKPEHKFKHIQFLSLLSSPEYYIKVMEDMNLIPTSSKLVIEDAETRKNYEVQRSFLKNFKNTRSPSKYLPFLLDKFCQGDYLKDSLAPLYFAFHKLPENELQPFLDKLNGNDAMSVRKHVLVLSCCVLDQHKVMQVSIDIQKIKNDSLQKCLCVTSLKYFSKNPNNEHFEKVLVYMSSLKAHDIESLTLLTSIQIPKNYKVRYIIHLWKLLEKLEVSSDGIGFSKLKSSALENIDKWCISNLPEQFCETIIRNYLESSIKVYEVWSFFRFVMKFLSTKTENFTFVFTLLYTYKTNFWHLRGVERKTIYDFFDGFYFIANQDNTDLEFVNNFSKEWQNIFSPTETFREYVLLNLLKFKKETGESLDSYSKSIITFAEQLNSEYGELVFSKFIPILSTTCIFAKRNKRRIELLKKIAQHKTSLSCILVMELISIKGDLFYGNKIRSMYREIDLILREVTRSDPKVQLHYNLFLRNNSIF